MNVLELNLALDEESRDDPARPQSIFTRDIVLAAITGLVPEARSADARSATR